MAAIPSIEAILLEIHQSLGLKTSLKKSKFIGLEQPLATHQDHVMDLLEEIIEVLCTEPKSHVLFVDIVMGCANFSGGIAASTWTHGASLRQVVWFMAGYVYAPVMGRILAFASLDEPLDKGMPGGLFWYLPAVQEKEGSKKLVMPVTQVVKWLMDLLGQPMDQIVPKLGGGEDKSGRATTAKVHPDSIARVLNQWLDGQLPRGDNIEKYFAEGSNLDFKGALHIDQQLDAAPQFKQVLKFVERKGLDADALRAQISMWQAGRIEAVLEGTASEDEQVHFMELLQTRYAPPSLQTIRHRLLIARAVQDGYRRLGKLLHGDDFDETDFNPYTNKIMQLLAIFQRTYSLTIEAARHSDDVAQQDKYFESLLSPLERVGICSLLVSSLSPEECGAYLRENLNYLFETLSDDAPLEDHVMFSEISNEDSVNEHIVQRARRYWIEPREENVLIEKSLAQIKRNPHWRNFEEIVNYRIAMAIANNNTRLGLKSRRLAIVRMRELASSPSETVRAICMELEQLFIHHDRPERPKNAKTQAAALLAEAKSSLGFDKWKAIVLHFEALHHLACNDFDAALISFNEALSACKENGFGHKRAQIAEDAFALVAGRPPKGFYLPNYEGYYRNMLAYGAYEGQKTAPLFEDEACRVAEYFWHELYFPYHGVNKEELLVTANADRIYNDAIHLIFEGDWDGFKRWLKENSDLRDKRLREARGHTVLMSFVKLLYDINHPQARENWRIAIGLMVEAWPKLVNMQDFKRQSPLMIAANEGDIQLVRLLLQAQAVNTLQDFKGRIALHAAVAARSVPCVIELLKHTPDVANLKTTDGNSVLHTAIKVGHPEIVKLLVAHEPALLACKNDIEQTSLDLANIFLKPDAMKYLSDVMKSESREIGSLEDFREIAEWLSDMDTCTKN